MHTDTSEKGLEAIIVASLVSDAGYQQGRPEVLTAYENPTKSKEIG